MSSSGSGYKGGTVYDGPPGVTPGTMYGGPPAGVTVYKGGTVYNGPAASTAPVRPAATQVNAPSGVGAARGASIFFLIAGFTGINTLLMFVGVRFAIGVGAAKFAGSSVEAILVANLLAAGVFAVLGIFAKQGNKAAFLIGILLYAGDLVLLVLNDPALHVVSIIIHGLFLYYLVSAFRQLA